MGEIFGHRKTRSFRSARRAAGDASALAIASESFLALEARSLFDVSPLDLARLAGAVSTSSSAASVALPRSGPRLFGAVAGPGTVASAHALMQVDQFAADPRFAGLDGSGFSTVILDTGINLTHPFFGPDANADGVADRIVYQYDFADNDPIARDVDGHGSNVSSIIASSDGAYRGIAPGASIIALKVFSDSGAGTFGSIERALQWTIAHAIVYNIVSVNMSLGDGGNHASARALYGIADELAVLSALNVIVVSAAGNSYSHFGQQGAAYPAADPNSIAVGAVYSSAVGGFSYAGGASAPSTGPDRLAPFSQRSTTIQTIFAVGAPVSGASSISGTITMHGTSQASPQVAGMAIVAQQLALRELGRRLTVAEFRMLLVSSAASITDGDDEDDNVPNTGASFGRVSLLALGEAIINLAPPDPPPGNVAPTLTEVSTLFGARANRAGLIPYGLLLAAGDQADANGDTLQFRVTTVAAGRLFRNGQAVTPGQTLVGPGDWLIYFPPTNFQGTLTAFTVQVFDGFSNSSGAVPVRIDVRPRALFASRASQQDELGIAPVVAVGQPDSRASAEADAAPRFLRAGERARSSAERGGEAPLRWASARLGTGEASLGVPNADSWLMFRSHG